MCTELKTYKQIYNKKPAKFSFSGQRLYTLNLLNPLPDGTKEKIPAYFTMLKDASDLTMLEKIEDLWREKTGLGGKIISQFKDNYKYNNLRFDLNYFAIECPQFKNIHERIRAIAEVTHDPNSSSLDFLQSASQISSVEKLNGAAKNMLRGLCAYAQKKKIPLISVISANKTAPMYENFGLKRSYGDTINVFEIDSSNYDFFINKFNPKYGKLTEVINEN